MLTNEILLRNSYWKTENVDRVSSRGKGKSLKVGSFPKE